MGKCAAENQNVKVMLFNLVARMVERFGRYDIEAMISKEQTTALIESRIKTCRQHANAPFRFLRGLLRRTDIGGQVSGVSHRGK